MNSKKLVFLAMGLVLVIVPLPSAADGKHKSRDAYTSQYYPHQRAIDGVLVDRKGWRQTTSWNNSCFRLLHLHSMYACSGNGD